MAEYTTKLHQHKLEAVGKLRDSFGDASDYILTDYRGLTVQQITDLRGRLRGRNATFKVVKNRYAKVAMRELDLPNVDSQLVGPTAIALLHGDPGGVAKILVEFAGESPLQVKAAIIGGKVYDGAQVEDVSKLPPYEVLVALLMGTMNGPVRNLMYAMKGVTSKLVRTLQAVADQKAAG